MGHSGPNGTIAPMKLVHVMTYDAPAAEVYAMLTDPEFQERRAQAGNPVECAASVSSNGDGGATIEVSRLLAVELPGMLQRLTGDKIRIKETQTWVPGPADADTREGRLEVRIAGQSGGVDGTLRMTGTAKQTRIDLDATIKANLPLVGGKIESFVAEMLTKFLTKEEELGRAWLADPPA